MQQSRDIKVQKQGGVIVSLHSLQKAQTGVVDCSSHFNFAVHFVSTVA